MNFETIDNFLRENFSLDLLFCFLSRNLLASYCEKISNIFCFEKIRLFINKIQRLLKLYSKIFFKLETVAFLFLFSSWLFFLSCCRIWSWWLSFPHDFNASKWILYRLFVSPHFSFAASWVKLFLFLSIHSKQKKPFVSHYAERCSHHSG